MATPTFLVLDIETIPDAELYTPAHPNPRGPRNSVPGRIFWDHGHWDLDRAVKYVAGKSRR